MPESLSQKLNQQIRKKIYLPLSKEHKGLSFCGAVKLKSKTYRFEFGPRFKYYDWASLTKPVFTMSLFMYLEETESGFVRKKVHNILPWFPHKQVTIKDLLSHQSGAPALYPVFHDLKSSTLQGQGELNLFLRRISFNENEVVYSDVGFFVLGAVLEEVFNAPLLQIFNDFKEQKLSSYLCQWHKDIHFRPLNPKNTSDLSYKLEKRFEDSKKVAPTEKCNLRNKKIQGEVNDESCWKMGGVAGHAGLFGSLEALEDWVGRLNNVFIKKKHYKRSTINEFYKKQKGDWRLGMMVPSQPRSTAGQYFSKSSYGHLGFTGTSFWVDPKQDFSVMLLSNRTYPDRRRNSLGQYRPFIHDIIWESLH